MTCQRLGNLDKKSNFPPFIFNSTNSSVLLRLKRRVY